MRILIALHQFPPEFSAGTETLALRTAQHLRVRGHAVAILTGVAGGQPYPESTIHAYDDFPVWRYHSQPAGWSLNGLIRQSYWSTDRDGLSAPLHWWSPDVVLLFHPRRLTLTFLEVCRTLSIPSVVLLTDYWAGCPTGQLMLPDQQVCDGPDRWSSNCARHLVVRRVPWLARLPDWCWRWLASRLPALSARPAQFQRSLAAAQAVVVPSTDLRDRLQHQGFSATHWPVIPYGIELGDLTATPPARSWLPSRGPLRLGFIGTLRPAKGAHVLLEALQGWDGTRITLALFGSLSDDPVYVDQLQALIGPLPGSVSAALQGTFPPDALLSTLRSLDLLVIPSLWLENSPLILLQALAARLPVLVSDVDGMRSHVQHGITGLLVPPGDAIALRQALQQLSAEPQQLSAMQLAPRCVREMGTYVDELEQVIHGVVR